MGEKMYVISAKKKKYHSNEFEWQYFQYDRGPYGSGYPILSSFEGARIFYTIEDAKKTFERLKHNILDMDYILSGTLAIREVKFKFVDACKL